MKRTAVLAVLALSGCATITAGMAGNILLGGIVGVVVDATSGATKELKPNPLRVKLEPIAAPLQADQ
jgi:hypothetical protein